MISGRIFLKNPTYKRFWDHSKKENIYYQKIAVNEFIPIDILAIHWHILHWMHTLPGYHQLSMCRGRGGLLHRLCWFGGRTREWTTACRSLKGGWFGVGFRAAFAFFRLARRHYCWHVTDDSWLQTTLLKCNGWLSSQSLASLIWARKWSMQKLSEIKFWFLYSRLTHQRFKQ